MKQPTLPKLTILMLTILVNMVIPPSCQCWRLWAFFLQFEIELVRAVVAEIIGFLTCQSPPPPVAALGCWPQGGREVTPPAAGSPFPPYCTWSRLYNAAPCSYIQSSPNLCQPLPHKNLFPGLPTQNLGAGMDWPTIGLVSAGHSV